MGHDLVSPPYRRAALGAGLLGLAAYGFAMANFTLAGDEWFSVFPASSLDTDYALWAGRWLQPMVWTLTGNGAMAPFVTLAAALALLVSAGLVAASAWRMRRSWAVFAVVALFVTCPLFADSLSFEQTHISSPVAMVGAAAAGWLVLRHQGSRLLRTGVVAALLVWSLASYQPTALVFAVVVLGGEVVRSAALGPGYWREAWRRWLEVLAALVIGVAVYALSVRLAWWITGTDAAAGHDAYSLVGGYPAPTEWPGLAWSGLRRVGRFWLGDTALFPVALKALGLALVAGGAAAAAGVGCRRQGASPLGRAATTVWIVVLAGASLVLPFAVLFLRSDPPGDGSAIAMVGLVTGFWGGLVLEGEWRRGRARAGRAFTGIAAVAVLGLALAGTFQVSKGFVGLVLSNQRDLANANRMLSVMEQMPEFSEGDEVRVELVGRVAFHLTGPPFNNAAGGGPGSSIVNCSGLSCQNRLVHLLNLIGGGERAFVVEAVSRRPAFRDVVAAMPPWPEPGSIRYLGGTFVVKGG